MLTGREETIMNDDAVAYTRDASWWNHPDTHSPKRLHRPSDRDPGMAACNSTKIMLVVEAPVPIANHTGSLCRRCFPHQS